MTASERLALRPLWLAVGWGMVAAVVILSLVRLDVDLSEGRDKWSHLLAYGAQMYWFCLLYDRQWRLAAWLVTLGVGLEVLQGFTGFRSYDVADMAANASGVLLGWLVGQTPLKRLLHWLEALYGRVGRG